MHTQNTSALVSDTTTAPGRAGGPEDGPSPNSVWPGVLMSYGELATALNASDMPTVRFGPDDLSGADLAAWVSQGTARLGGLDQVNSLAARSRVLRLRCFQAETATEQERSELRRMWPRRRATVAHDLAWRFLNVCGVV